MKINFEVNHKNIKDVPETSLRFCVQSFNSEFGAEMISDYLLTYEQTEDLWTYKRT